MTCVGKARSLWWLAVVALAEETQTSAQQSRSVFDAATVVLDKNVPPFRRMLDFDLDGDLDAVGVQLVAPGDFDQIRQLVPANVLVDLDGDGDLDAIGERIVFNRTSL